MWIRTSIPITIISIYFSLQSSMLKYNKCKYNNEMTNSYVQLVPHSVECMPPSFLHEPVLSKCGRLSRSVLAHRLPVGGSLGDTRKGTSGGLVTYTDTKSTSNLATTARHMLLLPDNRYSSCQKNVYNFAM